MRYAIYGIGGFGREVAPLALEKSADVVFVDDQASAPSCNGLKVITFEALCSAEHKDRHVIIAVGDGKTRQKIEQKCLAAGLRLGSVAAASVRQLAEITLGEGAVLCDQTILTANIRIGRQFQSNLASYVGHDCVIGDYVTFAPRVSCNGNVHIANYAYIGTGAVLKQGTSEKPLTIGEGAVVGMGAVVTKDVEAYTVVVGNPATVLKKL